VKRDSLHAMLERRYEAYKEVVIRPFFRDHFARLDRQVVLVDTIRALNAGPAAVRDLEGALGDILACFRQGDNSALGWLFNRRIDKVLFAATKADHIHSSSHDRLEGVMNRLVAGATKRARFAGAETKSVALAAVRATREGMADGHEVIVGTPMPGEQLAGVRYDGKTEVALFPGDLPSAPDRVMDETRPIALNFLKFQPPGRLERLADGSLVLPHIRLDRALDYLIGDKLR
jgi:predicted YcjX-like family ATPase